MGKKKRKKRKGRKTHLGGRSLGSTRKDPYNNRTWEPTKFDPDPYKRPDFKPVTGVTGKEDYTPRKGSIVRFKGPALDWTDRKQHRRRKK